MPSLPIVCLDNSDYSARPAQGDAPPSPSGRAELLAISAPGDAKFAYSAAHLSEIAPLGQGHAGAAQARADLLSELCGHNAFASPDKLVGGELACLVKARTSLIR